jgi:hypothetical protein
MHQEQTRDREVTTYRDSRQCIVQRFRASQVTKVMVALHYQLMLMLMLILEQEAGDPAVL